ncbi:homeobox-leucine zipper protein HOX11-like [Actinidia eriantha]|uniref:homeobox-leucine zipper protein HOX11-like n=1 Tax=Actinidia eriantha TaxID=165200 RepID=UPI0025880E31|nr:homeobox-leucine zipper protein HOX11-like [Actinidia eriantha]
MELGLSLGDTPKPLTFIDKTQKMVGKDLGFRMGFNGRLISQESEEEKSSSSDPPVQLDLLPFSPVQRTQPPSQLVRFPWLTQNLLSGPGLQPEEEEREDAAGQSSPNSTTVSSFQMDFSAYGSGRSKREVEIASLNHPEVDMDQGGGGSCSRTSDEEENIGLMNRKKLRLSKEQSAFLEDSFKENSTLNPKQKLGLAKQLNLRPRQVEVWFQNRRARTKLKQTEVDCEFLKKFCETLTEENRRLQKELQELRALKTSKPFYMQHPATTLTMCPSCERVASNSAAAAAATATASENTELALTKSILCPFTTSQSHAQQGGP